MVKKMKSAEAGTSSAHTGGKAAANLLDSHLAGAVKDSAQQIWLAGMGAFSKAQEEGGKVFEALVKEGMSLQKKTQGIAEEKISEVTGKMTAMAGTVQAKAGQNWDKLEAIFEAFVQSSRTKDGSGGTGLGLAISRTIMQAHGGHIAAHNREGGGSVFEIVLPARSGDTIPAPL